MGFDLETAKERLGITDNSKDDLIESSMEVALSLVELYCNRRFGIVAGEEEVIVPNATMQSFDCWEYNLAIQVHRIPITTINSVTSENGKSLTTSQHVSDNKAGVLYFKNNNRNTKYVVNYDGGEEISGAILTVLWPLFDIIYSGASGDSGGGGSIISGSVVKKTSIVGVGSIEYDTGSSGSGGGGSGGSGSTNGVLNSFAALLDLYRINEA